MHGQSHDQGFGAVHKKFKEMAAAKQAKAPTAKRSGRKVMTGGAAGTKLNAALKNL